MSDEHGGIAHIELPGGPAFARSCAHRVRYLAGQYDDVGHENVRDMLTRLADALEDARWVRTPQPVRRSPPTGEFTWNVRHASQKRGRP